ncbi:MAG: alpha/beta hydrolase [Thiotrichaceae bacterium]|nr:alpha/beta hydrolase [Thiotrichaceae bacterium]
MNTEWLKKIVTAYSIKPCLERRSEKLPSILLVTTLALLSVADSIQADEVTQKFNGLMLNANLELAEGKVMQDGIVLIMHGILGHNRMEVIESSQQALLDNGHSSLAINLSLGIDNRHGFYDCSKPHRHMQEDAIIEIGVWVRWLRDKDVSKVILMAHSRGSNQAMVYAVDKKDPEVTHLIFLAPGTVDDSKKLWEGRYGTGFDQTLQGARKLIAAGKGHELMDNTDFTFCPQTMVTANTFNSYYGDLGRFRNFPSYLPRITVPTLITTGTEDERQPDIKKHVLPYVDGKFIQLSEIEGAGHFFRDFNIEEAMEVAIEFLDNVD